MRRAKKILLFLILLFVLLLRAAGLSLGTIVSFSLIIAFYIAVLSLIIAVCVVVMGVLIYSAMGYIKWGLEQNKKF